MIVTRFESTASTLVLRQGHPRRRREPSEHRPSLRVGRGREHLENRRRLPADALHDQGAAEFISGVSSSTRPSARPPTTARPLERSCPARASSPASRSTRARSRCRGPGELVTEGLDGLRERLAEYRDLGARFAKWRAVITIGQDIPTPALPGANAHALARYAALCQEAGLVPIVEPEVLMDGDHTIERCVAVTEATLDAVFRELQRSACSLEGILLKPSMVLSGARVPGKPGCQEVAEATFAASGLRSRPRWRASCSCPGASATNRRPRT